MAAVVSMFKIELEFSKQFWRDTIAGFHLSRVSFRHNPIGDYWLTMTRQVDRQMMVNTPHHKNMDASAMDKVM